MNEEEKEAYYFFKEQRAMYNKWVADKTASESDVVLAQYHNSLFEILDKQQEEIKQEKEENRKKNIVIIEYQDLLEREQEKNKKLEEVIDMIAEDIFESGVDIICEKMRESGDCFARNYGSASCWSESCLKDCIKEYYFKVAKGEEYKNKYCGGED